MVSFRVSATAQMLTLLRRSKPTVVAVCVVGASSVCVTAVADVRVDGVCSERKVGKGQRKCPHAPEVRSMHFSPGWQTASGEMTPWASLSVLHAAQDCESVVPEQGKSPMAWTAIDAARRTDTIERIRFDIVVREVVEWLRGVLRG